MKIERMFVLPFPWCKYCKAIDPGISEFHYQLTGEKRLICKNEDICLLASSAKDSCSEAKNGN